MKPTDLSWLSYLGVFALGFVIGKIGTPSKNFTWDNEINLAQTGTLLISVAVSIAFYRRFERQKYSDKLRKDALLGRLTLVVDRLAVLQAKYEQPTPRHAEIVAELKNVRREFAGYVRFASAINEPLSDTEQEPFLNRLHTFNRLLTYTPPVSALLQGELSVKVADGLMTFSADHLLKVAKEADEVRERLFEIECRVIVSV